MPKAWWLGINGCSGVVRHAVLFLCVPGPLLVDNVFIERLWRSLKHEDIYLKGYADGRKAKSGIANWIAFYNGRRLHQALGYRAPMAVWRETDAGREGCGHDGHC